MAIPVAALAALALAPSFIDWAPYKQDLADRAEKALGRKVAIDGPVSLTLLPQPAFSAMNVRLANVDGAASPDMATVHALSLRLHVLPLLTGRMELSSLVLQSPQIHLERLADGRANWQFGASRPASSGAAPSEPAAAGHTAEPSVSDQAPRIDTVAVENGVVVFQRPGAAPLTLERINGSAAFEEHTLHLSGSAAYQGVAFEVEGQTATPKADEAAPVSLVVRLAEQAGEVRFSGQADRNDNLRGKISIKGRDLPRAAGALLGTEGARRVPAGPFAVEAQLTGSRGEFDATGVTLTCTGIDATGSASLSFDGAPHLDVKLQVGRLDLDSWPLRAASTVPAPSADTSAASPAVTPAPAQPRADIFGLPKTFSASVDLGAQAIVYRGGVVRDARFNGALANGELTVNQASLTLPGNSEINVFGVLAADQGGPAFEGSFEGATDDLRGLLSWLHFDTSAVPPDRLHAARLAGRVRARPGEVGLDGVQLRLDGAKIDAAATVRLGDHPAVGASVSIDTLNADAYWPPRSDQASTATPAAVAAAPTPTPTSARPVDALAPAWLDGMDANVKGHIGQLVARGITAGDVTFDTSWMNGQLTVHDLSIADLSGSQLHADGSLGGVTHGPLTAPDLHYELHSKQLGRLLHQMAIVPPFDFDRLGAVTLSGTAAGGRDSLTLEVHGEAGGAVASLSGKVDRPFDQAQMTLTAEASHASLAQLVRLFAPDYRPTAGLGGFAVSTRIDGDASAFRLTDLRVKAGPVTAAGEARLAFGGKPRIEAALTADEIPIDPFLPLKRQTERSSGARDTADATPVARPYLRGILPVAGGDTVTPAPRAVVTAGDIPEHWSHSPLDLDWLNAFDASLTLDAHAITHGGTRLDNVGLLINQANGAASLDHLTAQLYGGALTAGGRLSADGAAAVQWTLIHAQMGQALLGVADLDVADGVTDAEGRVTTTGHSVAEMIGRMNGSAKFAVRDGVIRGFDLKAANDRMKSLDSPASLLTLLQAGVSGGKTNFSSFTGTIQSANGLISSNDIALAADGGGAKGNVQINLPAYVMDARAEFHLADASNGPPLVMRLTGSLDSPRRFMDINEIQTWLSGRAKAMKGKLLQNLLNGGAATPADGQATTEKPKPKDMLKGLLKGLAQ